MKSRQNSSKKILTRCNKSAKEWSMAKKQTIDEFISFEEAAEILGVSLSLVYTWSSEPKLERRIVAGRQCLERKQVEALAKERSK